MAERDGYIAGVPCWIDTNQPDPAAAAVFYGGLFGWEFEALTPEGSPSHYLLARLRGGEVAGISSLPEGASAHATWDTYIWVDSADDATAKVRAAGGTVLREPFDVMDAGRTAVLSDTEGATFCIWEARDHKGASVVNEAGSLNFNLLTCRDLEAAKRFYGAVFGWTALDLDTGLYWAMTAYGDYLETITPGVRERAAAFGAPGFADVLAAITPIGDDNLAEPAHWGVTFSTDDAAATAAKAVELGGTVLSPPVDAPYSRVTVVRDPQGATFSAAQFVLENKDVGR